METKTVAKVGFYAALITTLLTVITFVIAFNTPPLSGPGCTAGCFNYPYSDIASRFPRDYYWMYPAMLLSLVYYVLMVSIHYFAPVERRIFSQIGMSFALISTATLVIDYFLQLSVIQPGVVLGETDGIAILSQFNPHGVFIVLEEIGFFMMSLSMLFMAPAIVGNTKVEKAIRWLFVACFVLNIISFTIYSVFYGIHREYRFEITTISINWLTLITTGVLLSIVCRRGLSASTEAQKAKLSPSAIQVSLPKESA
jgi:hypothetical protein